MRNGDYMRDYGAPAPARDCWPRFFIDTILDELATAQTGRQIYKDVERVEINMPGNPYSKPVQEVGDEQRQRWPEEYARFKKGQEFAVSGTPLEVLPFMKPSLVRTLKALDIMTAEQLAGLNDHALQSVGMGGRRLKDLAIAYLDEAEAMAIVTKTQAENDRHVAEIAGLKLQIEQLQTAMQTMFAQMQAQANAPNPLATHVPGMNDPVEAARFARAASPEPPGPSAFDSLPAVPTRRRKATAQADAETGAT